jgi:hypothetical protein
VRAYREERLVTWTSNNINSPLPYQFQTKEVDHHAIKISKQQHKTKLVNKTTKRMAYNSKISS